MILKTKQQQLIEIHTQQTFNTKYIYHNYIKI